MEQEMDVAAGNQDDDSDFQARGALGKPQQANLASGIGERQRPMQKRKSAPNTADRVAPRHQFLRRHPSAAPSTASKLAQPRAAVPSLLKEQPPADTPAAHAAPTMTGNAFDGRQRRRAAAHTGAAALLPRQQQPTRQPVAAHYSAVNASGDPYARRHGVIPGSRRTLPKEQQCAVLAGDVGESVTKIFPPAPRTRNVNASGKTGRQQLQRNSQQPRNTMPAAVSGHEETGAGTSKAPPAAMAASKKRKTNSAAATARRDADDTVDIFGGRLHH